MRAAVLRLLVCAFTCTFVSAASLPDTRARMRANQPSQPLSHNSCSLLPQLIHLRGGSSVVEKVQRAYMGVPTFTRVWLSFILALASLNQVGILEPEVLALDATATIKGLQLWRPLSAASFLGGLGPQLLQKCYYLIQFGNQLERTLGLAEFARVVFSCAALLSIASSTLSWQFIGDGLIMAITVLTCQQNPTQQVNLYGLQIPCAYLPFAQLCMSYLFTQQIPWTDIVGALLGYLQYMINDNCKPDAAVYRRSNAPAMATTTAKGAKSLSDVSSSRPSSRPGGSKGGGRSAKNKANAASLASNAASCGPGG